MTSRIRHNMPNRFLSNSLRSLLETVIWGGVILLLISIFAWDIPLWARVTLAVTFLALVICCLMWWMTRHDRHPGAEGGRGFPLDDPPASEDSDRTPP
jgi:hypothetical protein